MLPNQARYQLRYTRIFNFCHDTTAERKIKDFPVCSHLCGRSRFYTAFGNRGKSRKRRCHKALRRFALPRSGYRHGTPKAGALPTALHPVIKLFYPAGRILPNQARYQLRYTRILNDLMGMAPPEQRADAHCTRYPCIITHWRQKGKRILIRFSLPGKLSLDIIKNDNIFVK